MRWGHQCAVFSCQGRREIESTNLFLNQSASLKGVGKDANCSTSEGSVQSEECEEIQNPEWGGCSRAGRPLWLRKAAHSRRTYLMFDIVRRRPASASQCCRGWRKSSWSLTLTRQASRTTHPYTFKNINENKILDLVLLGKKFLSDTFQGCLGW